MLKHNVQNVQIEFFPILWVTKLINKDTIYTVLDKDTIKMKY